MKLPDKLLSRHQLAAALYDVLNRVVLLDIGTAIEAIFHRRATGRDKRGLRRSLDQAANSLVAQNLISRIRVFEPHGGFSERTATIAIASKPFVMWKPGDTTDHLDAFRTPPPRYFAPRHYSPIGDKHDGFFVGPYTYSFATYYPLQGVLAYIAAPPRLSQTSTIPEYLGLRRSVDLREQLPNEDASSYHLYMNNALSLTEHYLHVAHIYLHFQERNLDSHRNWRGLGICGEGKLGWIPDALLYDNHGDPNLALAFAAPHTNLDSIHQYCAQREIPYEVWGSRFDSGWYNPLSHEDEDVSIRDHLLREFGPISTIPVLSQMPGSEAKHDEPQ